MAGIVKGRWSLNLLSDHLPPGQPVLDASVIINLLGTKEPVAVLQALGVKSLVEQRTLKEVRRHPVPGLEVAQQLSELISRNLLEEVRMTDEEYEAYLTFVSPSVQRRLDVGESAALAVAARGVCVVIDERKARLRVAAELPQLLVVSSLKFLITSAHRGGWDVGRAKILVTQAIQHARMAVPREESALLANLLGCSG